MKNLFTAIQVTVKNEIIDNSAYNKDFDRPGFTQHQLPQFESPISRLERKIEGFLYKSEYGFMKFEREFTQRDESTSTYYISFERRRSYQKWVMDILTNECKATVTIGSIKEDATFHPLKNQ